MDRARPDGQPPQFAAVTVPGGGMVAFLPCPGRSGALAQDVEAVRRWGADVLVTLMEAPEFRPGEDLRAAAEAAGLRWHHLPIPDFAPPGEAFEAGWADAGPALRGVLHGGGRVALHCRGGLGRSGTVAARLLVEMGVPATRAIEAVRAARPGAIETAGQEAHLLALPGYQAP